MKLLRRWIFAIVFIITLPITFYTMFWALCIDLAIVGSICWLLWIDDYFNSTYFENVGLFGAWHCFINRILKE